LERLVDGDLGGLVFSVDTMHRCIR